MVLPPQVQELPVPPDQPLNQQEGAQVLPVALLQQMIGLLQQMPQQIQQAIAANAGGNLGGAAGEGNQGAPAGGGGGDATEAGGEEDPNGQEFSLTPGQATKGIVNK